MPSSMGSMLTLLTKLGVRFDEGEGGGLLLIRRSRECQMTEAKKLQVFPNGSSGGREER